MEKHPLIKSNGMLFQFSCWTAALLQYLWFASCSIATYFLPHSPLPGFNERKGEHHPWEILILLVWGWAERATREVWMLCLHPDPHSRNNFSLPGAPGGPEEPMTPSPILISPAYCLHGDGDTLCCSWLSTVWGWACLSTAPAPGAASLAWVLRSFHSHSCTGSDFSEKQVYD